MSPEDLLTCQCINQLLPLGPKAALQFVATSSSGLRWQADEIEKADRYIELFRKLLRAVPLDPGEAKACRGVLPFLRMSTDGMGLGSQEPQAPYGTRPLTPAQKLRKEADDLDDRETKILAFRKVLTDNQ